MYFNMKFCSIITHPAFQNMAPKPCFFSNKIVTPPEPERPIIEHCPERCLKESTINEAMPATEPYSVLYTCLVD